MTKKSLIKFFFPSLGLFVGFASFSSERALAQIPEEASVEVQAESLVKPSPESQAKTSPESQVKSQAESPSPGEGANLNSAAKDEVVSGHRRFAATRVREINLKGELHAEGLLYLKPSGQAGQSRFQIPFANIEGMVRFENDVDIDFEAVYRSPVDAGQNEVTLPRLNARVAWSESSQLTLGLFESASLEGHLLFWPWENSHRDLAFPGVRWGYLPLSDYGAEWTYRGAGWRAGVSLTNGEGYQTRDQGAQKDFSLWSSALWGEAGARQTELLLRLVQGGYENVPTSQARKDRYQVSLLSWAERGLFFGFEGLWSQDPVDSISQKIADAVDLTDLGGQRVNGRITSVSFGYSWGWREGSRWSLFGRSDSVQPVVGDVDRGIESSQIALSYAPSEGQEWILHLSSLDYGERHAQAIRDEQIWRISYNVLWD